MKPKLLDLFSGAGGAAMGYHRAGFDVTGVDIAPQKRFPFPFIQADALEYLAEHGKEYDVIHASPPCQRYSIMVRNMKRCADGMPDLISPLRGALWAAGKPYVIENVPGAFLLKPILLCGTFFCLKVYRHRLFESSVPLRGFTHQPHRDQTPKGNCTGNTISPKGFICVCHSVRPVGYAKEAMGIDWMTGKELSQAIPPAYTEFIGQQLMNQLKEAP